MDILNIADINVAEYVEYDTPDQTPVWAWIEDNATYTHRKSNTIRSPVRANETT